MTICIEWENNKKRRWIKWTHIFSERFVLSFMTCLFLWRFIDGIVNYYEWNCWVKMCLQMESHIHEKLLNDFNWLGVWISSRVVNWSEYHFYTMKSTFSRFLLPCTRLFQFRVGFTSMHCHCLSCYCCWFCCLCAFALLIMTCSFFFRFSFFQLTRSVSRFVDHISVCLQISRLFSRHFN